MDALSGLSVDLARAEREGDERGLYTGERRDDDRRRRRSELCDAAADESRSRCQRPCSRSRHGRLDARRLKLEKLKHGSIACAIVQKYK